MSKYKLHPSGQITPVRVHEKIGKLITEGYPRTKAVAIAYSEARHDWMLKHPRTQMPPWLDKLYGKNPISVPGRDRKGRKTNIISEKTAHKLRKASPRTFMKMTDEEIKRAVKVKKSRKKKRARKNPVSSLIKVFRHGHGEKRFTQKGYFTGTGWDTDIKKAAKLSAGEAKRIAQQLINNKKIPTGWGLAIVSG